MDIKARCDIIVPVYNALEDLRECVDSVLANTGGDYRLVLIDDKSTEPGISRYLKQLEGRGLRNVEVKFNAGNLGFVKTVNRGMRESDADVVLLNTDTVVPRGWLGKLAECAYSDETIASVTPLTNNGTICSVPRFCEDNPLPEGFSPQEMDSLVERISTRSYPWIPTAVGFCMYIKRSALDEVGYFDEETFGHGYAEENDWCCRAREAGYVHALDDATFVYHKGAMSFKGDKARLIENNLRLLIKKYPYYFEMIDSFVAENPLRDVQENLRFHLGSVARPRPRVLLVVDPGDPETHRRTVETMFTDKVYDEATLFTFWMEKGRTAVVRDLAAGGRPIKEFRFELHHPVEFPSYAHKDYGETVGKLISTFGIDVLFILGLKGHSLEIFRAAKESGAAVRVHDGTGFSYAAGLGNPEAVQDKWQSALAAALNGVDAGGKACAGTSLVRHVKALASRRELLNGQGFTWPEIRAAMVNETEGTAALQGYTEKQREAFNYVIALANRNPGPLRLAKIIYRLLRGKGRKA